MEGPATPITPLEERESIEQRVARTLRDLIVDGKLPAGTPLVQRDLAQQLGVSPTPVRAGLSQLEREGFVAVTPTGRAVVSRLTREDFEEIYAARLGPRGPRGERSAPAPCGRGEIAQMKETLRILRRLAAEQDVKEYLRQRWEFHATCYRASGRQRLVDEVERLFWRADRYNRLVLSTAERFRESVGRYQDFLAACEAHDGDRAEEIVQESIRWAVRARRRTASPRRRRAREPPASRRCRGRCARRSARTRSGTATPSATCTAPTSASTQPQPPRPRRLPGLDRRGRAGARARERAPDPGDAVRRRHEPRGPRDPGPRRDQPRPHPARPHRRDLARQPDGDGAGGRDPARARARGRRARPLLPRRPRRRRDARRHGGDERGRDDDGAVREDARERARARGGARRRARDPHRHAAPRRPRPATTSRACSSARRERSP